MTPKLELRGYRLKEGKIWRIFGCEFCAWGDQRRLIVDGFESSSIPGGGSDGRGFL